MADKSPQVIAAMQRARDLLQETLRTCDGMQEICSEMSDINVQLVMGVTIFARDLDGGELHIPDDPSEQMIPQKLSMEGEGADWLRGMKITLDDTRPEDSGKSDRCPCNGPGCPTCSPQVSQPVQIEENTGRIVPIDPGHHYHVIVETLPERRVLGIETCSSETHALNVMASWNQREDRIASMPLRPCHGDCPQVDR